MFRKCCCACVSTDPGGNSGDTELIYGQFDIDHLDVVQEEWWAKLLRVLKIQMLTEIKSSHNAWDSGTSEQVQL
jgi:hypothetical protein